MPCIYLQLCRIGPLIKTLCGSQGTGFREDVCNPPRLIRVETDYVRE